MVASLRAHQIHPSVSDFPPEEETRGIVQVVKQFSAKLVRVWLSLQLSHHGGEYSVERLITLDEYTQRTSLLRVVLVCLGTPLPVVLITILQESVPLQAPSDGWRHNYGFWFRYALLGAVLTHAFGVHGTYMIGGVTLSTAQRLLVDSTVVVSLVLISMVISEVWTFPIPFVQITLNMVFISTVMFWFRGITGRDVFQRILSRRKQLYRYLSFVILQVLMTIVYPCYQVLFDFASQKESELAVFLLLPIIKIMLKNVMKLAVSNMQDMIPETVIFTVDFFNAVYVATCMQRSTSNTTVAFIMALDLAQTAFALRRLQRTSCRILSELQRTLGPSNNINDGFLSGLRALYQNPRKLIRQYRGGIRVYSCIPSQLSATGSGLLRDLSKSIENKEAARPTTSTVLLSSKNPLSDRASNANGVYPRSSGQSSFPQIFQPVKSTGSTVRLVTPAGTPNPASRRVLHSSLEVLFTSECLLLTEYLEAGIPLLYGSYMVMMVRLPNAKYHTELSGITAENVRTVFIYALLELVSFAVLVSILHRNCRLQALYQLAFVLETHMPLVQTKWICWVLVTLSYRVVHFGVDFTFEFNWMQ